MDKIFVDSSTDFNKISRNTYVEYNCVECGTLVTRKRLRNTTMLCSKCKSKQTCIEKYGVAYSFQSDNNKEKSKQTKLERYGDENYSNREKSKQTCIERYGENFTEQFLEKGKKTKLERYGVEYHSQRPEHKEAVKKTLLEKYGDETYNNREKFKKTCLERYGVKAPAQNKDIRDKQKKTCQEKYNSENYIQSPEFQEKSKKTCQEKYGYLYYNQSPEASHNRKHKYSYDNENFDSSWELAFYIYHKDNNDIILREPITLKYYHDGKEHYYIPDFMINGKLYEIKGSHFFKEDKMICPFDSNIDDLYEAKHRCMIKNNVEIIMNCDKYIKYVAEKFGQDFLSKCKD